MEEIWKPIATYEDRYEVSNLGRVRSITRGARTGKILSPLVRNHGYLSVMLYGNGGHKTRGCKTLSIHRLVADAFVENPLCLPEVNHKDEDKNNNAAWNLEWISRVDNVRYGTGIIRSSRNRINNEKTSRKIIQQTLDGQFVSEYPSLHEAERATGVHAGNICRCANGDPGYKHAGGYVWTYSS